MRNMFGNGNYTESKRFIGYVHADVYIENTMMRQYAML